jgi:hypothetical protein
MEGTKGGCCLFIFPYDSAAHDRLKNKKGEYHEQIWGKETTRRRSKVKHTLEEMVPVFE